MNNPLKRLIFLILAMSSLTLAMGQLKAKVKCPDLYVDILNGTVNDLKPSNTLDEVRTRFPCFTSTEDESETAKCGGGAFYKDKDIFFYTKRRYIEIGPKFPGKLSVPLLGAKRNGLFKVLGNPKIKDDLWDAFEMQYGTLVVHYDVTGPLGKIKMIQFSTLGSDALNLCE